MVEAALSVLSFGTAFSRAGCRCSGEIKRVASRVPASGLPVRRIVSLGVQAGLEREREPV